MVLCELCKPCTHYDVAMEMCNMLHGAEMRRHPTFCDFRKEKDDKEAA